ncbi:MAG: ornithine cyclodeaminase [Epulopiscium sp.]|nr:ornithine cyclodeaminase [Candidatus Epulonipiscium sp.]
MKIITHSDIKTLDIRPQLCYQWVNEMICHKQKALLPPKISLKPRDGVFCNVMPCIIRTGKRNFGGVKVVTRYPRRKPSLQSMLLLFDADTGDNLALIDANWITAMRTGAVAAHSIQLFARKEFNTVGMIGLGNTARATMLVLSDIMPEKRLKIKLMKYKRQAEDFKSRLAFNKNYDFTFVKSYDDVVKDSDVVVSAATYLPGDICTNDCFGKGILLVPIHTLGFTNCDLFFDKVFADDEAHVRDFRHFDRFRYFAETSDVANGIKKGRESDDERILVYNIGVSIHDVNFASKIYQMMLNKESETLSLQAPTEKFWI